MFYLLAITISLLTCTPGEEVYAHYGHTAIRVQDSETGLNWVFNYGLFDFDTDHFYSKFVRGETYYELGIQDGYSFASYYEMEGRDVYEQVLNLTDSQAVSIFEALMLNYEPVKSTYLYNFVFDNCATRPYRLIRQALGGAIHSSYNALDGMTYRQVLNRYTDPRGWIGFGINMVFGHKADVPLSGDMCVFLPDQLMYYIAQAFLPDGTPLVKEGHISPFRPNHVPWYGTWYVGYSAMIVFLLLLTLWDRKRKHFRWYYDLPLAVLWLSLFGISFFLANYSIHPFVGFNARILLFPLTHLCVRLLYLVR